jgi:hypothetical protein
MLAMIDQSDSLRTPDMVCQPDPRSPKAIFKDEKPLTVEHQYEKIAKINLHDGVPEDIRVQFETTRNLYLYAWFVYRFYPVAEHHAYACLELALRERFEPEMLAAGERKYEFGPGLKRLLTFAKEKGYLKDENFSVWRRRTEQRALSRTEDEIWKESQRKGLKEITFEEMQYEIKDVDRDHEYIGVVIESLPWLRNHYAHGSKSLHGQVMGTINLISEIINQIFPENNAADEL